MKRSPPTGTNSTDGTMEFSELHTPQVFWALFGLAGFALTCMGLAAHSLLGTLLKSGDVWDLLLVSAIYSAVPIYLFIGVKLAWVRRYVILEAQVLRVGYRLFQLSLWFREAAKQEILNVELVNQRPTANLAPKQHGDSQYYIRGHWRLVVRLRNGKEIALDRHTEKGALQPLYTSVRAWLQN